jgi:hypothetical protein
MLLVQKIWTQKTFSKNNINLIFCILKVPLKYEILIKTNSKRKYTDFKLSKKK